ncbi:hypothetical protein [Paratractidigestivibacter sp.]|uniref:hypothetical protein n=1 Tax=Paratractidigestivibacter sp. TaxID=2847316 RepID=UPI0040258104
MGVEQKQAKKPRGVRRRVAAGVVATSLAVAAAVAVPAAGAIGGPGFGLGDEAPGIDVPGTGVKEPWATIEVNGEEPKDYYDEGSVDVKVTVGPGDDYVASRILVNGSAQDDWARTDLADGSRVYEKALAEEGTYRLVVINDMAWGDALMPCAECRFAIDRTAPQATVAFDSDEPVDGACFDAERTATIVVDEENFDKNLVSIGVGGDDGSCEVSDWKDDGPRHSTTIKFRNSGKAFSLKVEGADLAGHPIEFGREGGGVPITSYASGEFIVDTVAPVVRVARDKAPANSYEGVDYYNDAVTATVTVTDDHFDAAASAPVINGSQSESEWAQDPADPRTWTKKVAFGEGARKSLFVHARDLAGNVPDEAAPELSYGPFAVDMTAPEVTSASVSAPPANSYSTSYYFYDRAASASIRVFDEIGLGAVSIADNGDGYYNQDVLVAADAVIGNAEATATLAFADGHEFDRDVVIRASDLAKNERYWSISPTGKARALTEREVENLSVFDPSKVYPEGLLKDTVAPRLMLSGAEEGRYYNTPQTVGLVVDELNFPYLQAYEPDQGVLTVTKQEGVAGRAQSSWTRPASSLGVSAREGLSFTDEHGAWRTYDQFGMGETLAEDGHYVIDAQLTDPARNHGTAHLGEFTIDRTAPVVRVDFDNDDARNGKYYKAARTATVAVIEHNFDPGLIRIDTTGEIGVWSDDGDTHTVTVAFATDGACGLAVSGKDKAGNEMTPYKADEFVVDLTPPTVTITGVEDAHAYNDEVMPAISFSDEANFDPAGAAFSLKGTKNGEVSYNAGTSENTSGSTVSYTDFTRDPEVDDIYTLTAHLTDLAGNEADASLTFSVNRFGSTFRVVDADVYVQNNGYLTQSRGVTVEEVNVSGVGSEEHGVAVTRGVSTLELTRTEGSSATGYSIDEATSDADDSRGWALYRYNISAGNFSEDGRYHVSVHSNDLAKNMNTSSGYFERAAGRESVAEVDFILDTTDPVVTDLSIRDGDVVESRECEGSFKVVENVGIADVKVFVDGREVPARGDAYGNYTFRVQEAAFTDRDLRIVATDLAGRSGEAGVSGFRVTTDILELHLAWVVAGALTAVVTIAGVVYLLIRRKKQLSCASPIGAGRGRHAKK